MAFVDKVCNFVDAVVSIVNPERSVIRQKARVDEKLIKRTIEGINSGEMDNELIFDSQNMDTIIENEGETVRERIHYLELNDGAVRGPIRRLTKYAIGRGLAFQSRIIPDDPKYSDEEFLISSEEAERVNYLRERKYKKWVVQADSTLLHDQYKMQSLIAAALLRDGEALVIGRYSNWPGRYMRYCQELVEIDRVSTPMEKFNDVLVRNGIKYNEEGIPVGIYVLKYHPGDSKNLQNFNIDDYELVSIYNPNGTKKVLYIFDPFRPEQRRGLPELLAGLPAINDVDKYKKAELSASVFDASLTGFVKTSNPKQFQGQYTKTTANADKRVNEFGKNMIHYINDFEDIKVKSPTRPNDKFDQNVKSFYRDAANALDMPLEAFLQDWHDINYSNGKMILLQTYERAFEIANTVKKLYCIPSAICLTYEMVAEGKIKIPLFYRRALDFCACDFVRTDRPMVLEPHKERQAQMLDVMMGLSSPSLNAMNSGVEFDEVVEQIAKDLKKVKDLEEKYDVKLPPIWDGRDQAEDNQVLESEAEQHNKEGSGGDSRPQKGSGKVVNMRNRTNG